MKKLIISVFVVATFFSMIAGGNGEPQICRLELSTLKIACPKLAKVANFKGSNANVALAVIKQPKLNLSIFCKTAYRDYLSCFLNNFCRIYLSGSGNIPRHWCLEWSSEFYKKIHGCEISNTAKDPFYSRCWQRCINNRKWALAHCNEVKNELSIRM